MFFYSFYTSRNRDAGTLVLRTEEGWSSDGLPKLFNTHGEAQSDFFKLLWDNEDFRIDKYIDTDSKTKKPKKQKIVVEKVERTYERNAVLELNKVYNEDCLQTMANMPNGFVDKIITSPPYNVGSGIRNDSDGLYEEYEDNLSEEDYEKWLFKVIDEMLRVTKDHVFLNIQMLGKNKRTVCKLQGKYAEKIKDIIIWNKKIAPPHIQPGIMNSKWEYIIILSNQNPHLKKFEDGNFAGNFNNVIEGINASGNEFSKLNKATFPLYLPRTILNYFGKPGELIYDPFNGTGTTAEACIIEKRDYIGSEIDINQCDITNKRIVNERARLKLEF